MYESESMKKLIIFLASLFVPFSPFFWLNFNFPIERDEQPARVLLRSELSANINFSEETCDVGMAPGYEAKVGPNRRGTVGSVEICNLWA